MNNNPFKSTHIEFHILQSFPVTCLNRDDVGAPKVATVGGSTRARVSSQCWKRQVRLAMHELGITHGSRTKLISDMIAKACLEKGANDDQAKACGDKIEQIFIKKKEEKKPKKAKDNEALEEAPIDSGQEKTDTLLFLSPKEVGILAEAFAEKGFDPDLVILQKDAKKQAKEMAALIGEVSEAVDALDIALFGRMVAQAAELNIEAAASFSHAISTHKISNEVEFFTALDDLQEDPGAAHMGSLEFNSATYYRYVSLDLGQLCQTLAGQSLPEAVEAFTKALFVAIPAARQTTQSGASPWEYAKILIRKGQRLQVPFETAVKAKDGGFLQPSITALSDYLANKEKLFGSLFGKIADYTWGEDTNFSIDDLVAALKQHAEGCGNE
ncbi:type I-E CRISPR-associated protein Cas7/Cse4/CasC [Candidatus Methylomicrobium oryzae]|jgi:CRISPR system Cascade subunit CasC|uniref:type I-E CRISPR-associated protein Cas7/Cse4/CasC n=1 Tax=Candidatus Methylomicrobium oryzae TaxID=2802053 RepID=UPI0019228DAD|nr:type I-E CRISPR-associated protein Cas7/Cse4/CasC [Methylomicrobium sp. RS1]MBL1265252.1 type I-E CRISPR-associated protein Cas7/Cse4/CasC [Methylomicrobium sp. RS1]